MTSKLLLKHSFTLAYYNRTNAILIIKVAENKFRMREHKKVSTKTKLKGTETSIFPQDCHCEYGLADPGLKERP